MEWEGEGAGVVQVVEVDTDGNISNVSGYREKNIEKS